MLTKLGEAGANAFQSKGLRVTTVALQSLSALCIRRQKVESAIVERLEAFNRKSVESYGQKYRKRAPRLDRKQQSVATPIATVHGAAVPVTPYAPVAQRLEQQTHNLLVRGSNPRGGINKNQ